MLSSYVWVAACLAALHDLSRPLARGSRLVDLLGRPPLDVLSLASPGDPCRFEPQPRGRSPRPLPCLGLVLRGLPRLNRRVRWGVRGEASICLCRLLPSPSPGGVDRLTAPPLASLDSCRPTHRLVIGCFREALLWTHGPAFFVVKTQCEQSIPGVAVRG